MRFVGGVATHRNDAFWNFNDKSFTGDFFFLILLGLTSARREYNEKKKKT